MKKATPGPAGPGPQYLHARVRHPGPRYRSQGRCSGEEFREDVLIPYVNEQRARGRTPCVVLDDAEWGYPCGWLEEVFGGLVRRMPDRGATPVTPVSRRFPDHAAEAIGYMRAAARASAPGTATEHPEPTVECNRCGQETDEYEVIGSHPYCDQCAAEVHAGEDTKNAGNEPDGATS